MTNYGTEWPPTAIDVKTYLGIESDNADKDDLLLLAADAARGRVERYCQREFKTATRTYYLNGDGSNRLPVPDWPITSITSVVESVTAPRDWTVTALSSDYYQILNGSDNQNDEGKHSIQRIDGGVWPRGEQNLRVIAVTGYTEGSIPDDLYFAAVELTAHIFLRAENKRIGQTSRTEQGGSVQYDMERAAIPLAIKAALDPFRSAGSLGF